MIESNDTEQLKNALSSLRLVRWLKSSYPFHYYPVADSDNEEGPICIVNDYGVLVQADLRYYGSEDITADVIDNYLLGYIGRSRHELFDLYHSVMKGEVRYVDQYLNTYSVIMDIVRGTRDVYVTSRGPHGPVIPTDLSYSQLLKLRQLNYLND